MNGDESESRIEMALRIEMFSACQDSEPSTRAAALELVRDLALAFPGLSADTIEQDRERARQRLNRFRVHLRKRIKALTFDHTEDDPRAAELEGVLAYVEIVFFGAPPAGPWLALAEDTP